MAETGLPLESLLSLQILEQKIANLTAEDLRILFMQLAIQKAKQEQVYKILLQQASESEKICYVQLNKVEKEYQACRVAIAAGTVQVDPKEQQ